MAKPKILVTGANGQLGQELREIAPSFPSFEFIFLTKEDLPIDDAEAVNNFFNNHHPEYCINCAAYTAVDKAESEQDAAFRVNGEAVGLLAAACKKNNSLFIHISTDYVFDGMATTPYNEDSTTHPMGVYGASKLEGEKQALQLNPGSIIIRTSWVYSKYGKNFVKTMMKLMHERDTVNVVSDQYGCPTYAADLAEAIMQIITPHDSRLTSHASRLTPHGGIYHFSNKGTITWYDFAVAIKTLIGSDCHVTSIPTSQYPTPAKRPLYSVLDTTKIQQTFGIGMKDWKESLSVCIQRIAMG